MGEAFVWASTDPHLGICISSRVFGSMDEAKNDAQECVGDKFPITWVTEVPDEEAFGEWSDPDQGAGGVRVQKLKVRL